ncbi:MAG: M1 family aminopeptidase [Prolixibacteraceae bacterium]
MRNIVIGAFLICSIACFSQKTDSIQAETWKNIYRASATKINDLVHTKLDVNFDYSKSWMYGKAWITLHPHFYATDSLNLDAKGMKINEVSMIKMSHHIPLKYEYDGYNLRIILDKTYKGGENYTVFIEYIAKPDDINEKGSINISGGKGLYFINPLGKDKNKPTQIWTHGETESNSVWFPTIDKPNQKTTYKISMTVPDKYQTLSNGVLTNQKKNMDGTRTDTWVMDLPHAPYLMMMAVGEYAITKDSYQEKEVSYYVEKEYAPVASKIFGQTPEMIAYFSLITGIDYPWPKYAQIAVRDFVSGAMENTTATIHDADIQQNARQLIDENTWEITIAHELFHQWFGNYVTSESWSNVTLNESFANFGEVLWMEYKHGKDAGDAINNTEMHSYLRYGNADNDLVRFHYSVPENMFDAVSYNKGGRILNMLRNFVGDSAFFKSLKLYLTTRKFQSAEAHDLRLAFEEVTGQDLNWFWNQWYFSNGHPIIDISYEYDSADKTAKVYLKQTQTGKIFKFPIKVDIYQGSEKKRYNVWVDQKVDTLTFPSNLNPSLVNVDADKILLCKKTDHKTLDNFIFQYHKAGLYVDRSEAIDFAAMNQGKDTNALNLLITAMNDKYYGLRIQAVKNLNIENDTVMNAAEPILTDLANNDPKSLVRAVAIKTLGKLKKDIYKPLFLTSINDSSYAIAGGALLALGAIDSVAALEKANILTSQHAKGALSDAITETVYMYSSESEFDSLAARFDHMPDGYPKFRQLEPFANFLKRVKNTENFKKGIDMIVSFRDSIPILNQEFALPYINGKILNEIATFKQSLGLTEQADYVNSKLPAKPKDQEPFEISEETLQKYPGEYEFNGGTISVVIMEDKTLKMILQGGTEMPLTPHLKDKFGFNYPKGDSIEFTLNEKNEVTELLVTSPYGQFKAPRKK